MSLDRPILILGTPRSGKSMVRNILGAADEFLWVEEPLMMWNAGHSAGPDDRRLAADATPPIRARIRSDCENMLARAGKTRYLDVLAYHALRIPFIREVMPEARIVHIIREPVDIMPELLFGWTFRDTVTSAAARRWRSLRWQGLPRTVLRFARNYFLSRARGRRASWGPRPPGLVDFAAAHSIAEVAAFQWRELVEIATRDLADCPPETWIEVRLDRILASPREQLQRIIDFAQPADPQSVLDFGINYIDRDRIQKRKVHPTPEDWQRIAPIIAPLRERLGYGPLPADFPPPSPSPEAAPSAAAMQPASSAPSATPSAPASAANSGAAS